MIKQKMLQSLKLFNAITGQSIRYNYSCLNYVRSYSRDIMKSPPPTSVAPDYLLQNLRNATSTQNVLDLVGAHYKIMNSKQLLQALRSLFSLQKFGNTNISTQKILKHPDFEKLCYSLKSQAGLIELQETMEALKVISYIGASSNSTIVQVLLQLLRHNLNDLTISNLIFLDFLLRQFKRSPLVDGLQIALPIVFETNLADKLDKNNLSQIADALQFVSKNKSVSENCVQYIVNCFNKAIEFHGGIDIKIGKSIIWSICDMEPNEIFVPLYKKAITELLSEGFDKLSNQEVVTTFSKVAFKTTLKSLLYYDDIYYDAFAHHIIDKDIGFEEAIFTLLKFTRVSHTNDGLLNYISGKFIENPNLLVKALSVHVYALVSAIAQSEFKPNYWQDMKDVIQATNCFKGPRHREVIWFKLATYMCALDIYNSDVFESTLSTSHLQYIIKHGVFTDFENFLLIYQYINVFKPEYKHLLPQQKIVQTIASKVKAVIDYPLEGFLQKALGGENYVMTCMKTKLYHHIDHVILMRKGGFPIPFKRNYKYIEDIDVPTDGFMILVLALNRFHYTINTKRLKATSLLYIKTLEVQGYNVVPICLEVWENLSDFERIPFIMQAIRLKIDTQIQLSNVIC